MCHPPPRPYFGQSYWFNHVHSDKLPSAQDRYQQETRRVLGVLESVLTRQEWLVGGKITIADLSFVPYVGLGFDSPFPANLHVRRGRWNNSLNALLGGEFSFEGEFPATYRYASSPSASLPVLLKLTLVQFDVY